MKVNNIVNFGKFYEKLPFLFWLECISL